MLFMPYNKYMALSNGSHLRNQLRKALEEQRQNVEDFIAQQRRNVSEALQNAGRQTLSKPQVATAPVGMTQSLKQQQFNDQDYARTTEFDPNLPMKTPRLVPHYNEKQIAQLNSQRLGTENPAHVVEVVREIGKDGQPDQLVVYVQNAQGVKLDDYLMDKERIAQEVGEQNPGLLTIVNGSYIDAAHLNHPNAPVIYNPVIGIEPYYGQPRDLTPPPLPPIPGDPLNYAQNPKPEMGMGL